MITERQKFELFAEHIFETITEQRPTFKTYPPISAQSFEYTPGTVEKQVDTKDQNILIITDAENEQCNEWKMVEQVKRAFAQDVEVMNLNSLDIKGGCTGCCQCGYDNTCIWEGKDEYIDFFRNRVMTADILIFAGTTKDRYLSSRWKTFFDRSFFRGHVPSLNNKQIGWIISGPLSQNANLRQILEAYIEMQPANCVDIVTDESQDSAAIDARLTSLAANLVRFAEKEYVMPSTYLTVGGQKIFRDGLIGGMRMTFQADHRYYQRHGMYDFPQKDYKTRLFVTIMSLLTKLKGFRTRFYTKEIKPGMIQPLQKAIGQA